MINKNKVNEFIFASLIDIFSQEYIICRHYIWKTSIIASDIHRIIYRKAECFVEIYKYFSDFLKNRKN